MAFGNSHCSGVIQAPTHLSYLTVSLSAVLAMLTIPGNILVLIIVVRTPRRERQTPFIFLVANLAAADLMAGSILEPMSVINHVLEALKLPKLFSIPIQFSYFFLCTVSVLSLAALSIDRYLAVSHPFWYRINATPKNVLIISFAIWVFSGVLMTVYFKVGFIVFAFVFGNTSVAFTFSIFLFTYLSNLKKLNASMAEQATSQTIGNGAETMSRIVVKREKNLTKLFLLMLFCFLACFLPAVILIYLMNFCDSCSCIVIHWFRDLHFVFVLASSAINPFLYTLKFPGIRRRALDLLPLRRNRVMPINGRNTETVSHCWFNHTSRAS